MGAAVDASNVNQDHPVMGHPAAFSETQLSNKACTRLRLQVLLVPPSLKKVITEYSTQSITKCTTPDADDCMMHSSLQSGLLTRSYRHSCNLQCDQSAFRPGATPTEGLRLAKRLRRQLFKPVAMLPDAGGLSCGSVHHSLAATALTIHHKEPSRHICKMLGGVSCPLPHKNPHLPHKNPYLPHKNPHLPRTPNRLFRARKKEPPALEAATNQCKHVIKFSRHPHS